MNLAGFRDEGTRAMMREFGNAVRIPAEKARLRRHARLEDGKLKCWIAQSERQ